MGVHIMLPHTFKQKGGLKCVGSSRSINVRRIFSLGSEKNNGEKLKTYRLAFKLILEKKLTSPLLTHTFPQTDYKEAINLNKKENRLIKSSFKI